MAYAFPAECKKTPRADFLFPSRTEESSTSRTLRGRFASTLLLPKPSPDCLLSSMVKKATLPSPTHPAADLHWASEAFVGLLHCWCSLRSPALERGKRPSAQAGQRRSTPPTKRPLSPCCRSTTLPVIRVRKISP